MQHFTPVISNDASSLSGNLFPIVVSHRLAGSKSGWSSLPVTVDVAIKLRNIRDVAETSLVMRDGNGNHNSHPMFLFSIWCHPRIPRVSKNMDASCIEEKATMVREPGNEHDRFAVAVLEDKTLCTVGQWWFSARFPRYQKRSILRELVEVVHISNVAS